MNSEDKDLNAVKSVVNELWKDGIVQRGHGRCIAISDVVQKLLLHYGIQSYLQECSLLIKRKDVDDLILIGYPGAEAFDSVEEVKTHVVCITKTKKPILIDLSIINFAPGVPYVCEYIDGNGMVEKFDYRHATFFYSKKYETQQLPELHERSIVSRIKTDNQIFANIKYIKLGLLVVALMSSVNMLRGFFDFYYTFLNPQKHPTREFILKK